MSNNQIYKDLQLELESSMEKISLLEAENSRLKEVIKDNDLQDEIEDVEFTSVEEQICIEGIKYIGELVKTHQFDQNDIKNFDTLYKVLRQIRGQSTAAPKGKKVDIADALKVVNGMKK